MGSMSGGVWRFNAFGESDLTRSFISRIGTGRKKIASKTTTNPRSTGSFSPPVRCQCWWSVRIGIRCVLLRVGATSRRQSPCVCGTMHFAAFRRIVTR